MLADDSADRKHMNVIFDHPESDALELHLLNRLVAEEAEAVEEHLLVCGECRSAVGAVEHDIQVLRAALS